MRDSHKEAFVDQSAQAGTARREDTACIARNDHLLCGSPVAPDDGEWNAMLRRSPMRGPYLRSCMY